MNITTKQIDILMVISYKLERVDLSLAEQLKRVILQIITVETKQ